MQRRWGSEVCINMAASGKSPQKIRRRQEKNIDTRRLKMTGVYNNLVLLAMLVTAKASPLVGPEPIRCAPCTQEKLDACPAVSADCQQVLREPGCGCCMACALQTGASCGVHTAHCGEGLRCSPRPGEARPLYALTRGHGICTEDTGQGCAKIPSRFKVLKWIV